MLHPIETKSSGKVLGLSPELGSFLKFGMTGGTTPSTALALYRQSTAVSIPINLVAESFATIKPVIEIDGKFITDHPVLDLLMMPSPFYSGDLFREVLAKDYLITGESEIVALGNINRPPIELQPISPANATVTEGENGFAQSIIVSGSTLVGNYRLVTKAKTARYFDGNMKELTQIRSYSSRDNSLLRGESPLVQASAEARQHIEGNKHNTAILVNGGSVSLLFNFKGDMSPDDFQETKSRIENQVTGGNSGRPFVTNGTDDVQIQTVGSSSKDMDYATLQTMAKNAVALQYKVPLSLISIEAATMDNFKVSILALYDYAVLPLADRIFGGLTDLLMVRYGLDPAKVRITYDPKTITALATRTLEQIKLRKDINVETTNELRSSMGNEPVGGGDVVYQPVNLVPIGTDIVTEPEPSTTLARDNQ